MADKPVLVTDLNLADVEALMARLGQPAYRARQLLHWVFKKQAVSFEEMTDFPQALRQKLSQELSLQSVKALQTLTGRDGTIKALLALFDGRTVETALMPSPGVDKSGRYTLCVSTQVGCAVGCPFCATGQQGFERNLSPAEIVGQVLYFARWLGSEGVIGNIVFMGMGEPLANYDNLMAAVEKLNAPWGFGLGARNMTISTAGIVPGIEKLSKEKLQVGLAVSLHAATNELRSRLVPLNRKYPLERLIPACKRYVEMTGRRISFEYCLFAGINDSSQDARALAHLIAGLNCHVNLIAANETGSAEFKPPLRGVGLDFQHELMRLKVNATLRKRLGLDIKAGCGQLRSRATG